MRRLAYGKVPQQQSRLRSVADELAGYLTTSEAVFLETGGQLMALRGRVERLVKASGAAAALAPQAGEPDPQQRLADQLRSLRDDLGASQQRLCSALTNMDEVLGGLGLLLGLREPFEQVSIKLWSLSLGICIESATIECGESFLILANEVGQLGKQIGRKFDAVLAHGTKIQHSVEEARARTELLAGREARRLASAFGEIEASLEAMRQVEATAVRICTDAGHTSQQLMQSLEKVITAIQSHDITRQMVEHVIEALHQGDEDFDGGALLTNGVAPAELTLLRRLQASQLRTGHDKLVSALGQMATELGLVSTAAVGLADETRGLAEPRTGALLDVLEKGIDGALLAFREHRAGEGETAAALGQVGSTVRESVAVVKELDTIGHTVAMIALNAQVAAEKAGTDGRTVSVLAREIHEVADHIAACTAPVSDTLRGIAAAGSRLTDLGGSDPLGDRFMEELRTLLPQLRASRQALTAELGVLRDDGQRLRAEVQHLLARISSATSVTSRLRELADELDAGTVAVVEGAVSAHETPRLSAAVTRYTMEDERVVHRKIIGADSIGPRSVRPLSPNSDTSLGDNVELF